MLGFVSVYDPNAAQAAYLPSDVAPGDSAGMALALANQQAMQAAMQRKAQLVPGLDNSVLLMIAVAVVAVILLKGGRR